MADLDAKISPKATEPFANLAALRVAHRELLDAYGSEDEDDFSDDFLGRIEDFQARAQATGVIIAAPDDRSEVQSTINFWSTILLNAERSPKPVLLEEFDSSAARARMGDIPPYKGLEPFQTGDAATFFGRISVIKTILDLLRTKRLIAVTGLSGSGKSSIVRAGLIPQLQEGAVPGSEQWIILEPFVPGADPLAAINQAVGANIAAPTDLAAALDDKGAPVVLVIDQFEELYTLSPAASRTMFLDALVAATGDSKYAHVVVIAMRGEFDTNVAAHETFKKLFDEGRVPVGALSPIDLRSVIELPAVQLGVEIEPGLADELVSRVLGEPAGLPLLQFTLLELWKRRADGSLKWSDYKDLGGNPRDILAQRADEIYDHFLKQDQDLSERIFTALVQIGDSLEATSRRIRRSQLDRIGDRDRVDRVIELWRSNGLIRVAPEGKITAESEVQVTHEALIRNWERLVKWVEQRFAQTLNGRALLIRAQRWEGGKEEPLGQLALAEADEFDGTDPVVQRYLAASRIAVARQERWLKRRIKLIAFATTLSVLLAVAAAVGLMVAINKSRDLIVKENQLAVLDDAISKLGQGTCVANGMKGPELKQCTNQIRQQIKDALEFQSPSQPAGLPGVPQSGVTFNYDEYPQLGVVGKPIDAVANRSKEAER